LTIREKILAKRKMKTIKYTPSSSILIKRIKIRYKVESRTKDIDYSSFSKGFINGFFEQFIEERN